MPEKIEQKIFQEIMHFHYMTFIVTSYDKNSYLLGHEIYNFGRPILGRQYYIINLSDICPDVKKKTFKEMMHFHCMTYIATP